MIKNVTVPLDEHIIEALKIATNEKTIKEAITKAVRHMIDRMEN